MRFKTELTKPKGCPRESHGSKEQEDPDEVEIVKSRNRQREIEESHGSEGREDPDEVEIVMMRNMQREIEERD